MVGDIDRPGSEAKITVGPVRCQGDRKLVVGAFLFVCFVCVCVCVGGVSHSTFGTW